MEPDLNFLLGFSRLRIKSILEILHSNCWMQSEPVTVIQALAACAALSPESNTGSSDCKYRNQKTSDLDLILSVT